MLNDIFNLLNRSIIPLYFDGDLGLKISICVIYSIMIDLFAYIFT